MKQDGKSYSKWAGMMTKDKEMIVWNASGQAKETQGELKGIVVIDFMTKSEKYAWMNSIIAVADLKGNMMDFTDTGYVWE